MLPKENLEKKLLTKSVPSQFHDMRVDMVLVQHFELSRAQVRKYIDQGMVFLNKKRIWIAKYAVAKGDLLEVNTDNGDKKVVEFSSKNILFENDMFLIVNKPAGMVVEDTNHKYPIFEAIKSLSKVTPKTESKYKTPITETFAPAEEFFIVHRIDKETSGLLIVAKNVGVQKELIRLWSAKKVQKFYQCLTFGVPKKLQGFINSNIGQQGGRNQYATGKTSSEGGKNALTMYKVNAVLNKGIASIINCEPKTGRSHQIRVHLASIDCPLLGDKIYSNKFKLSPIFTIANRQMLHASQLIFELYGVKYNFHAPVPSDFNQLIKYIKTAKTLQISKKEIAATFQDKPSRKHFAKVGGNSKDDSRYTPSTKNKSYSNNAPDQSTTSFVRKVKEFDHSKPAITVPVQSESTTSTKKPATTRKVESTQKLYPSDFHGKGRSSSSKLRPTKRRTVAEKVNREVIFSKKPKSAYDDKPYGSPKSASKPSSKSFSKSSKSSKPSNPSYKPAYNKNARPATTSRGRGK